MKLAPPKPITFWIALLLGVLGVLGTFMSIPLVSAYSLWFPLSGSCSWSWA